MTSVSREELLAEGPLAKFLRYVRIDTQSDPTGPGVPTTPGQLDLCRLLAAEAEAMGLGDVHMDAHGIVTATLEGAGPAGARPGPGAITVGLLAHVDTSPAVSGRGVAPIVHRAYRGGPITLPAGPVLDPAQHPALAEVVGHDLVTSDGSTLLGADDKAGVAEIMAATARLLAHPDWPRPRLRLAFTTDEETGRGVDFLDIAAFGADVAYTLDGGGLGDISFENFNAVNVRVTIRGRSAHPGTARGHLTNAVQIAAQLVLAVPADQRPETTDGREGFIHFDTVRGDVQEVVLVAILRDFAPEGLRAKSEWLALQCAALQAAFPACVIDVAEIGGYRNMREAVERRPEVMELALAAMRAAGVEPRPAVIRGGTDGAKLSARGLPTPNLFAGGMDFHSRTEWISAAWMDSAVDVLVHLAALWAGRPA